MASIANTKGVDISEFNGNINLEKVKKAGYKWVMIRCGYGSDMTSQDDSKFEANVKKAEAAGLPWGAYFYTYSLSEAQDKSELNHILRLLKGKKPTMPIALDVEDADGYKKNNGGWTSTNVSRNAKYILEGLKKNGYYPILYTGFEEIEHYLYDNIYQKYDMWFAHWAKKCGYTEKNLTMWQYGGETNLIDGNSIAGVGTIDKDMCYKDYPTIIKNGGYNNWGKTSTTTTTNKTTTTTTNSKTSLQNVINTAKSLLNHDEHSGQCDIMYWYGGFSTGINSVACCCAGQMYLFYKAGAFNLIPGGKVADCGSLCKNFYNAKQLYGPKDVKPGDLVIFSWSKSKSSYWPASSLGYNTLDHVELCIEVNNNTIKCIGANNGGYECDDFQLKTRDKANISCCCRPKYSNTTTTNSSSSGSSSSNSGNSSIKTIQGWLNSGYHLNVTADGIYGPETKKALVKALQFELNKKGSNLTIDGIYGNKTNSAIINVKYGDSGNLVKILQAFLICNGYSTNGFDGLFGQGTLNAVKSYQTKKGLSVDGIAGKNTFSSLCK